MALPSMFNKSPVRKRCGRCTYWGLRKKDPIPTSTQTRWCRHEKMKRLKFKCDQWDVCQYYERRPTPRAKPIRKKKNRHNVIYSLDIKNQRLYLEIACDQESWLSASGHSMILAQWTGRVTGIHKNARIVLVLYRSLTAEEKLQLEMAGNLISGGRVYETNGTSQAERGTESVD